MSDWAGTLGDEYTDRNPLTPTAMDAVYMEKFGVARSTMNERFLGNLPRDIRILELGCNIGTQLLMLEQLGFTHLSGIEINPHAVKIAQRRGLDVIQGDILHPFFLVPPGSFDLVFTSGVLIHIPPDKLHIALQQAYRATTTYIWGWEYWCPHYKTLSYLGRFDLMWEGDFARMYLRQFSDLDILLQAGLPYKIDEDDQQKVLDMVREKTGIQFLQPRRNIDNMFLLRKRI